MPKLPSKTAKAKKIKEKSEERRRLIWPKILESKIWDRTTSDGYSTVPRTLTLIASIADNLAKKNKRVSSSYIGLWCRVWDAGVVEITNEWEMATESGFTGERRVYTWRDRMKELIALEFILVSEGPKGPYQFVLIINPYQVIYDLYKLGRIQEYSWIALNERAKEIGASDIQKYEESLKVTSKPPKATPKPKPKPKPSK